MIYIDIDGVLADSDGYLKTQNPEALKDTHTLFKTIYKYHETAFKESQPLVDLKFLEKLSDFTLLTAMPNKSNIDSFTDDIDSVMNIIENNKREWVKKHIGDCKLIILYQRTDKSKFCKCNQDVLIDDNKDTGKRWKTKGGLYYSSVAEFLKKYDPTENRELKIFEPEKRSLKRPLINLGGIHEFR